MTRVAIVLLLLLGVARAGDNVHHYLVVRLAPRDDAIAILDRITGVSGGERFRLHAGLTVTSTDETFAVEQVGTVDDGPVPLKVYELQGPANGTAFLRLVGKIHHPLVSEEQEYARSFSRTPGIISSEGVVLSGGTYWLPHFEDRLLTFTLTVDLPAAWDVVSQGKRTLHEKGRVTWECKHPMEEVYLIAARFNEYARPAGKATAYAFLRTPDVSLASKYLETTAQYLEMYRGLIGPYPFEKFALVENFWETGYGMPSFTLLGPRIIRFPFILHSSYPHEILHNWWGNSVYVDWETGNWCEGLTAYLADHLIKEGQGKGFAYRRDTLKKYRDYVRGEKDFPLVEFRSRHSSATEAVGYGKSAMLFHMLRMRLGDAAFARGLQRFYREFKFKKASFGDLGKVFGSEAFVRQWVERPGAPVLAATVENGELVVRQAQAEEPFDLLVPVAFTVEGEAEARVSNVALAERSVRVPLPEGTRRVDVDPYFDVFRMLDRAEIPPTLGEVFGAERVTLVLPRDPGAWRALAEAWTKEGQVEVVGEQELEALPKDRAVWILGTRNAFREQLAAFLAPRRAGISDEGVRVGAGVYPLADHSFVFTAPHPGNPELAIGWIGGEVDAALPGLARKLPHYGKYSYLAFSGNEPTNVAKGQWEATGSPLIPMAEGPRAALPPREPLARLAPAFDSTRLMGHVRFLAAERMRGRGAGTEELDEAAQYIADAFEKAGLVAGGSGGGWFQVWEEPGGPGGKPATKLVNVVGVLPGKDSPEQTVVLGAHYDHLGLGWPDVRQGNAGQVHNGADDNASGVAVLLELAQILGGRHKPRRSIAFVAFSGEEWGRKGSLHYVRSMRRPAFAMVNLDTVGRLEGKKLTILGSGTASEWKHIAMGVGYTTGVEAVCVPQDPGGSDQVSFHEAGVPAVQVFTGPHEDYHRPTDDVGKVDADGLVKVATFVRETLVYLGDREAPLTRTSGSGPAEPTGGSRRVSLGTMPDFAFGGPGVKVASVLDGTPAAKAGIETGDILLAIDDEELDTLRTFSMILKQRKPGDVIRIRIRRGGKEQTLEAKLAAR